MRNLLITLTVVEIALVIAVLAFYLIRISASLHETARHLAKSTYGVRAVETQWVWSDGSVVDYTNWNPGEPNGGASENSDAA